MKGEKVFLLIWMVLLALTAFVEGEKAVTVFVIGDSAIAYPMLVIKFYLS